MTEEQKKIILKYLEYDNIPEPVRERFLKNFEIWLNESKQIEMYDTKQKDKS